MLRKILTLVLTLSALGPLAGAATAQQWPNRPIKFIIGWSPGGLNDVLARLYNDHVGSAVNQPVVMEYKPGAGGRIGMVEAARARPDGYTLALGNLGPLTIAPHLYTDLGYDPQKSFVPVSALGAAPLIMVVAKDATAKSWKELLEESKTKPLNYGVPGIGSPFHLTFELLRERENFGMVGVPYKGTNEQIPALLSGQVHVAIDTLASMLPLLKDGRLRALAVTSAQRVPQLPDVPTLSELGYEGLVIHSWYAVLAPAGTPQPIVDRLAAEYRKASETENVRQYLSTQGLIPLSATSAEFAATMKQELERWGRIIKARKITVQ